MEISRWYYASAFILFDTLRMDEVAVHFGLGALLSTLEQYKQEKKPKEEAAEVDVGGGDLFGGAKSGKY